MGFSPNRTYDFIWSAGLFDYFNDELFVFTLKRLLKWVNDGGEIIIGNFVTKNPSQPVMEVLLDWKLILRSNEHLLSLAQIAGVPNDSIHIEVGKEGVQLFLTIRR